MHVENTFKSAAGNIWRALYYTKSHQIFLFSFSFDVRGRAFNKALFWSDTNSFGPRAYFVTVSRPAALSVENVALEDGGVSKIKHSSSLIQISLITFSYNRCIVVVLTSKTPQHETIGSI